MIRPILTYPTDIELLHKASAPVNFDSATPPRLPVNDLVIDSLVTDMFDSMYAAGGVGLAAIQLGVPLRVFVMDASEPYVFINPKPLTMSGKPEEKNEGCLSLPGVTEIVHRFPEVLIEAQNTEGEWGKYHFTGLEAQCVQHEHEHLDGIIIPDKLSAWRRERLRKQLAKARK